MRPIRFLLIAVLLVVAACCLAAFATPNIGSDSAPLNGTPFYNTTPGDMPRPTLIKYWGSGAGASEVSFWQYNGSSWVKMTPPANAPGDTFLTVKPSGFDFWEFPFNQGPDLIYTGTYPGLIVHWFW